jgi:type I restriction enzyme, S subunit
LNTDRSDPLPLGWSIQPIASVCAVNPKKPATDALKPSDPVTFVPMPAVDADAGVINAPLSRAFADVRKGFTAFANEDVIVAKITPCFENGKAALCRGLTNGLGFGSTEFHVLRCTDAVIPEYIYHFVRQESFRRDGEANMTGSVGQKRVPADWLKAVEIPLGPLAEQRRIVAKVNAVLARVNAARQRLAKVPALLKRFRQSTLAAVLRGEECSLGEVLLDLKYGTSKKCEQEKRGVPVLRIPNVSQGVVDQNDLKYAELDDKERKATELLPGDLLMIRSNGSVSLLGRTALVTEREKGFSYAGYLMRLRLDLKKVDPKYAYLALSGHSCRDQIEMPARSTSGVNNINSDEVRNLRLPLPSLAEQHEIVRRVEALFALADKIEARVTAATARADKLIQATLAKAFRGNLVHTEAELAQRERRDFEPAHQLLERIHDARHRAAASPERNSSRRSAPFARKAQLRIK